MKQTLVVCKPRLPAQYVAQRAALLEQLQGLRSTVDVLECPLFDLVPLNEPLAQCRDWVLSGQSERVRVAVFVSPSVLEMALLALGQPWPTQVYCAVMGHQSARLAERLGVPSANVIAPGGHAPEDTEDSAGLARLLQQRFQPGQCDVLLCKGPRGRSEFPVALREMGHEVTVLECYDRQAVEQDSSTLTGLVRLGERAVLWLTSSETVTALSTQLDRIKPQFAGELEAFKAKAQVLTTHPRIEARCKEMGFSRVTLIPTGIQSVSDWLNSKKMSMTMPDAQSAVPQSSNPTPPAASPLLTPVVHQAGHSSSPLLVKATLGFSLLSLVLVLLVAFAGKNQIEKTRMAFGERIQKESTTLDLLKDQMTESSDLGKDLRTRFDLLEQAQKEEASQRASLQEVYNNLLASRTEVSLSEVEQLISIARRQLYLLGNVNGAAIAMEQAIELLERSDKPSLISLRRAIEKDLAEVKALPVDDVLKLAIALDSVINSIDTLPMLSGADATTQTNLAKVMDGDKPQAEQAPAVEEKPVVEEAAKPTETAGPAWSFSEVWPWVKQLAVTAWRDVRSLVEITRVDTPEVLLLSAQQEADLRNGLRLSLLNARVTLLSRQGELLKSDVVRSQKIIATYFDTKNPQVERALAVLKEVEAGQVGLTLPELKASTAGLRLAMAAQKGDKK